MIDNGQVVISQYCNTIDEAVEWLDNLIDNLVSSKRRVTDIVQFQIIDYANGLSYTVVVLVNTVIEK